MKPLAKMEVCVLPCNGGYIKIWIYGYRKAGDFGRVVAVFGDTHVTAKGYNRKKTIIRSISKLNQVILDQQKGL